MCIYASCTLRSTVPEEVSEIEGSDYLAITMLACLYFKLAEHKKNKTKVIVVALLMSSKMRGPDFALS